MNPLELTWDSPSQDSAGSMPIGNGEVGVNFWVEEDGDLLFYISRTDAWSESATLLKLGRVRVSLDPNPFARGLPFEQSLKLGDGEIVVQAGSAGSEVFVRAWVDARHPVVRIEIEGQEDFETAVSLEVWRTEPSVAGRTGSKTLIVGPDTIVDELGDQIVWYHRNGHSWWPMSMKHQGLKDLMAHRTDPLLGRTFGGVIAGDGLVKDGDGTLRSRALRSGWTSASSRTRRRPILWVCGWLNWRARRRPTKT